MDVVNSDIFDREVRKTIYTRFNRVIGQINGIKRMIENDKPIINILTQSMSAQASLYCASKAIIRYYLENTVAEIVKEGKVTDEMIEDIIMHLERLK